MATTQPARSGFAVGITITAGIVLMIGGACQALQGIVAIFTNEFFVTTQKWVFQFDVTAWGWIHLIVGLVAFFAGFGLFSGRTWARTVGVIVAGLSILVNFVWLPYYPVWAVLLVTFDLFVIWALTAHGRDIKV